MTYLVVSALLFALGAYGALTRRTAILVFLSVELMLNAANLSLITFSRLLGVLDGQVVALFVIAIAAAEVAVGLGLIIAIFRRRETTSVDELRSLRG
ncbi:MAG: NADH-quinone oxidoreductase subunit NuoK [Deinococcus sp.]|nr:NADH-quinone oxidoreductase subunit NuoK [Deinococcus sp.]MCL5965181.1 NADH-quinone oxidoreductase subunit NuoK [Deinococcus sp.]